MFSKSRLAVIQEQKEVELQTRRMIFESCDFNTIIENPYLKSAMGW
jgi:hypothetical protein